MTFVSAVSAGYLARGRLSRLAHVPVRWPAAAVAGTLLQVRVTSGVLQGALLAASFALLAAFALVNIRVVGIPLILAGMLLNSSVMAVNGGMPVSASALVASSQAGELQRIVTDPGAKHHLATSDDRLMVLADVIPVGPIRSVVSVGDLITSVGLLVLIVSGMRGRAVRGDDRPGAGASPLPTGSSPQMELGRVGR